ncbi:MAG: DUF4258 domain-containing protein [Actinobacteria bacterium]|nr:DUF4258 domain-containing protein [Actinomycetota bacterium]
MKEIYFTKHSIGSMRKRGVSEDEVITAISNAKWQVSKWEKLECNFEFEYNKKWNEKYYNKKQVVPIFVEEEAKIVVITVYAFYF